MKRDPGCIFCRIVAGEIPSKKAHEDDDLLVFHDIAPWAPVHVLVIPKKKVARFADLKNAAATDVGEFFRRVSTVATELGLDKGGYRVVINNGKDGQQTVEYIHAHILGGRGLTWPPG